MADMLRVGLPPAQRHKRVVVKNKTLLRRDLRWRLFVAFNFCEVIVSIAPLKATWRWKYRRIDRTVAGRDTYGWWMMVEERKRRKNSRGG
jgi:hypothetical protein